MINLQANFSYSWLSYEVLLVEFPSGHCHCRLAYSSALAGSLPHFKASFWPPAFSQNLPLSIKIWSTCVSGLDSDATDLVGTSYHDQSSLSCLLISWGSVKTETLPALCNKKNKPIDLIHLRCGWQLTLLLGWKGIYGVSGKCSPPNFLPQENVSLPNMHTPQTQTGT